MLRVNKQFGSRGRLSCLWPSIQQYSINVLQLYATVRYFRRMSTFCSGSTYLLRSHLKSSYAFKIELSKLSIKQGNTSRRVHTNPLKCALDQITSSCFEPIRIRSVHTLFTESEFDYGLPKIYCEVHNDMKVYLEIYAI